MNGAQVSIAIILYLDETDHIRLHISDSLNDLSSLQLELAIRSGSSFTGKTAACSIAVEVVFQIQAGNP